MRNLMNIDGDEKIRDIKIVGHIGFFKGKLTQRDYNKVHIGDSSYLGDVKKGFAFILSLSFFFSTIIMPYSNFNDNDATKEVYDQQQQKDPDLNLGEFIFTKLLCIGQVFDSGDDDDDATVPQSLPIKNQQPLQALQLQAGFLDCNRLTIKVQDFPATSEKPTCTFRENKFSFDFHASIFHPPALAA